METGKVISITPFKFLVLTVPMRNGNFDRVEHGGSRFFVLTVPMRNGNKLTDNHTDSLVGWFLPYLWGMETLYQHSQRHTNCLFLPHLWGMETLKWDFIIKRYLRSYRTYEEWKPYRGNRQRTTHNRSYRTYEEWKHLSRGLLDKPLKGFLPYLWGMETFYSTASRKPLSSSYRTYEEWKPRFCIE